MSLTSLFCNPDDFCLEFEPEWYKQLVDDSAKPPAALSEIMTIALYFHQSAYRDFKHYCIGLIQYHDSSVFPGWFPTIGSSIKLMLNKLNDLRQSRRLI